LDLPFSSPMTSKNKLTNSPANRPRTVGSDVEQSALDARATLFRMEGLGIRSNYARTSKGVSAPLVEVGKPRERSQQRKDGETDRTPPAIQERRDRDRVRVEDFQKDIRVRKGSSSKEGRDIRQSGTDGRRRGELEEGGKEARVCKAGGEEGERNGLGV
jgi:hypothetical protein